MGVPVLPGKGAWGNDVNGNQVNQTNSATSIWALILGALQQIVALGGGGGSGGSVTVVQPTVTPNIAELGASATQVIPIGAKGWTYAIQTGTATINGAAVSAGMSDSDLYTLAATITIITGSASSAYVRWNT